MRLRAQLAAACLVAVSIASAQRTEIERAGDVSIFRIEGVREFAEATVPGAIRHACAADRGELEAFFSNRGVALLPSLIRRGHGFPHCHVFFEPTLPGFRASADDEPITGLFGALDPAGFVVGRKPLGDSLEILKFVLGQAPHPLRVTLTVNHDYDPRHWPAAAERHFGNLPHQIETRASRAEGTQPWAQDYLKSGWAAGVQRLLVPYRLFEGRARDGDAFRPLLDGLEEGRLIRSKLSWEGGDLQFARNPRDPSKLILFHGSSARAYWGAALRPDEYAYVLRTEFGANQSIDLGGVAAHVDYVAALLPRHKTILLSVPVRGDLALAQAAGAALREAWGDRTPQAMTLLLNLLNPAQLAEAPMAIREQLESVRRDFSRMEDEIDPAAAADLGDYAAKHCPSNPDACFEGAGRAGMFERDPALLRRALDEIVATVVRAELTPKLLGLIEAQLRTEPWRRESLLDRKAKEIEGLGFRVIRAPHLLAENAGAWPGVSYVNSLVWDAKIFTPTLGLGDYEAKLLADLQRKLGPELQVVPVPARHALLRYGGVHCVFGLVRSQQPIPPSN